MLMHSNAKYLNQRVTSSNFQFGNAVETIFISDDYSSGAPFYLSSTAAGVPSH